MSCNLYWFVWTTASITPLVGSWKHSLRDQEQNKDAHSCHFIQHSFVRPSHGNQKRKKKRERERIQTGKEVKLLVFAWHDTTHRKSYRCYQKTTRAPQWIWERCRGKLIIIITHGNLSQSDILTTKDEKERPILFNITTKRIKCIGLRNKPT